MRTIGWILVGALVAVGAIGIASYRHVVEPKRRVAIIQPSTSGPAIVSAPAPVARRPLSDTSRTTPLSTKTATRAGWHAFETVINVLNVVVGVLGIWMTVHGMRLQRSALAVRGPDAR